MIQADVVHHRSIAAGSVVPELDPQLGWGSQRLDVHLRDLQVVEVKVRHVAPGVVVDFIRVPAVEVHC